MAKRWAKETDFEHLPEKKSKRKFWRKKK